MSVCAACTFVNDAARSLCEICETPLKKAAAIMMERFAIAADNSKLLVQRGWVRTTDCCRPRVYFIG